MDSRLVMLADRQTTGGYTKIGTVISVGYPEAGTERSGIQGTLCQSRRGACSEFVYPQAPSASESGKTAGTSAKGERKGQIWNMKKL